MFAQFRMEQVDQHVAVIQHNPPTLRVAVVMPVAHPLIPQATRDLVGNGLQMRLRVAGANQKIIGD